jgi:DNA-binding NarL/FixJ family response regulator
MYSSPEVPGQLSRYPPLTAVAKVAKCRHSTVVNAREDLAADARRKPRETAKTERRMDKRAMKRLGRLPTFADLRPCPFKRHSADALPFGMQYCRPKPRNLPLMKILVVDDHALIREAVHGVLKKLTRDAVILDASNCAQTVEAVASHPDISLILLDLNLPDRDGFSMLAELRERNPAVSVVVLSATQDRATVMKALDLGAMGYIPKSGRNEVMLSALQLVFAGGIYIPPEVLAREHLSQTAAGASGVGRAIVSPADLGLTDRQLDVLALMMQGKNNKLICQMLNLAEHTVKNHVGAIFKALKVTNRTEAVIAVNEMGWKLPATPKL